MKRHGIPSLLFAVLLLQAVVPVFSADSPPPVKVDHPSSEFDSYKFPKGSPFHVLLTSEVDTALHMEGQKISSVIPNDIYMGIHVVIPRNTRVDGFISRLEPPLPGRHAILALRFDMIQLPNGDKLPIRAYVKTERADHAWGGELTPGTKPERITFGVARIGYYNKTVFRGPRVMGNNIRYMPGTRLTIILEEPFTVYRSTEFDEMAEPAESEEPADQ